MAKKVYKYGTGHEIPEGAVYLSTQVEKTTHSQKNEYQVTQTMEKNHRVWHYFLVETNQDQEPIETNGFIEE